MLTLNGLLSAFGLYWMLQGYVYLAGTPLGENYFGIMTVHWEKTVYLALQTAMVLMGEMLLVRFGPFRLGSSLTANRRFIDATLSGVATNT